MCCAASSPRRPAVSQLMWVPTRQTTKFKATECCAYQTQPTVYRTRITNFRTVRRVTQSALSVCYKPIGLGFKILLVASLLSFNCRVGPMPNYKSWVALSDVDCNLCWDCWYVVSLLSSDYVCISPPIKWIVYGVSMEKWWLALFLSFFQ
jgi:hypothetical protein